MRRIGKKALSRHLYVLGGTGVGKTFALLGWILQLIFSGEGVAVIDPHGDLIADLLQALARRPRRVAGRLVLIDPLDGRTTVGLNPLELKPGEHAERRAQFLATVVTKIYHADPLVTARMQRLMFHAFWLLIAAGLTLLEYAPLLTNRAFREGLLETQALPARLTRYWRDEFPGDNARLVAEWTQSSLNKVDELVADPAFELILGQQRSTIDLQQIMDEGRVLLVNLAKGELGEKGSYLMGAFIMALIQLAALARARQPQRKRRPFTVFVDEFQNMVTDDIHTIMAESRKFGLSLVLAHQYYEQLRAQPILQAAVLNTVGNLAIFRVGAQDAAQFARDIFQPPVDEVKAWRSRQVATGVKWRPYTIDYEPVWRPLPEIWELEARRLTALRDREFWYKRRGPYPAHNLRTIRQNTPRPSARLAAQVAGLVEVEQAGQLYVCDPVAARREIEARHAALFGGADDDLLIWDE